MSDGVEESELPAHRARWRVLVLLGLVAVLVAGLGGGGWWYYQSTRGPLPTPDEPWPTTGYFVMFLCIPESALEECDGRGAVDEERREIERVLRAMPEVSEVRFETRAEALASFRASSADDFGDPGIKDLLAGTVEADMPESFRGRLSSITGIEPKLKALRGVATVRIGWTDFWAGRADLAIRLCSRSDGVDGPACAERDEVTTAEKAAIFERLRSLDVVTTVYLEDGAHADDNGIRMAFGVTPDPQDRTGSHPGTFHVALTSPEAIAQVKREMAGLPGVKSVAEHRMVP